MNVRINYHILFRHAHLIAAYAAETRSIFFYQTAGSSYPRLFDPRTAIPMTTLISFGSIFKGERNEACPKKYAEKLASQLSNAEGGAVIYTVKGLVCTPREVLFANSQLRRYRNA
jgi:hypothetical protein